VDNTKRFLIVAFIFSIILTPSCVGSDSAANNSNRSFSADTSANTNSAHDNAEELGMIIKLPFEPVEVVWIEKPLEAEPGRTSGTNDKKLTAVLRLSPKETNTVISEAEKTGPPEEVEISVDDWYPVELVSRSELGDEPKLKGLRYSAEQFYQSPYLSGTITRIGETDFFVLELFTR
jgi:hypothetical protein